MAPNRKKKKPSSNPARGFATTSTISKSKIVDNEIADEIAETVDADPEPKTVAPENPAREGTGQKELHELSPDQLEARLEESELQLLVEKHGEKVKKDAARQVLRLQTERRLIRSQAFQLATSRWLPEELLQLIFNHLEQEKKLEALPPPLDPSNNANTYSKAMTADELSIRLWALRQALIDLGFMQPRVEDALDHLVQIGRSIDRANSSAGKEGLWGVEDCLDWLAMSCTLDELPDYETHRTEAVEKLLRESVSSFPTFDFDTRDPSLLLSDIEIPAESVSALDDQDQKQNERSTSSDSLDRDQEIADDDLEPHEILDRYLSLKARLHERRPDLTEPKTPKSKGKGSKNKLIPSQTPDRAVDPDSSRLMKRIRKIERDILFDLEDAQEKWSIMRVKLLKDAADRKKLGIDDEPSIPEASAASLSAPNLNPTGTVSDEDSALDLGDFFASLPEEKTDAAAGRSGMTITAADGTSMSVRDFGQWSGLGPRRVFEEACRARDSLSRVIYSSVSSSSFSCRHSILVRWSRAQELIPTTMICGVTCHADSRNVSIEMVGVSTPDLVQSEAFVSTASLFIIFAGKPKEEKAYLRLPATWRDLWDELVNLRNEEVAALDRERLREIRKMVQAAENKRQREEVSTPNPNGHVEALSSNGSKLMPSIGVEYVNAEDMVKLWTSRTSTPMYINMLKSRMTLPIWKFKSELLDAIEDHQVTIVCGETGCGKSTQVPAYILERELLSGRDCKIYCTEPRRISAISLARRVSEELGEGKNDVGTTRSLVGYAIRLESQVTSQTRLVYATTGIVMRMLESGNQLEEVTHLVLDEVHERTIDSDFLLIVLRKLMIRRPGLKVILMSATVNAEQFSRYLGGAPILNVPGRTFPVQTKYLEDAIEVTNYGNMKLGWSRALEEEDEDVDASAGTGAKMDLTGYSTQTRNTLAEFNEYRIDYDLIVRLLETISRNQVYAEYSKAILVFLPGIAEIRTLNDMLVGHPAFASHNWYVYPLHSTIATEDQERAFLVPPKGIRKIVLATNIAETGITIPDVTSVIDTGKHKEMRFAPFTMGHDGVLLSNLPGANNNADLMREGNYQDYWNLSYLERMLSSGVDVRVEFRTGYASTCLQGNGTTTWYVECNCVLLRYVALD
ncbi:hypothetical protein MMC13_006543 [Lambiella insularis]|nr:hypothetical protein [Lambiella insularis]